ncbi:MAG: GMP synthase [glutamine-hydrolyzing] [Candidatus Binatia bacterium]|nr:MAG: GMP synthase [glutamine-hydrolyzing] [Candidatus Binatia bacterium]
MILILDFGSQYTQLIARRVREAHVYAEIHRYDLPADRIRSLRPRGIVLSGGPASVYEKDAPEPDPGIWRLGVPVLGICYGLGLLVRSAGGRVARAARKEYGPAEVEIVDDGDLFSGMHDGRLRVWMSHGDRVEELPAGWQVLARSENSPVAACRDSSGRLFGVQFHPEVAHTPRGQEILRNFLFRVCGEKPDWTMEGFLEDVSRRIREEVGDRGVVCALSGGIDSTVVATLLHRAVGDRLACIFVDNGLLRQGEAETVLGVCRDVLGLPVRHVDSSALFLERLRGVEDPERKRRIIGLTFVEVFEQEAALLPHVGFLAQGTLYPDVIESVSFRGPSATIKSHHNVGGLPERMKLRLLEPLRELFKDEVRELGRLLGVPDTILRRHPFPGPGLAVRILGPVTRDALETVRKADRVVEEEIRSAGLYEKLWQAFAVLLPVRTVGVMGDGRTYEQVVAVRAVESTDGMTADWARLPPEVLERISTRIINEVPGVNRVVYDVSSKPPATIEWE